MAEIQDTVEATPEARDGTAGGGTPDSSSSSGNTYQSSDGQDHNTPEPPRYRLEIENNQFAKNWWDRLPDFDPRIYDAIAMEQASACVTYIHWMLPDIHELENLIEARKFRRICPRLKVEVPRTEIAKPKEVKYETSIDSFINKDQTY